MAYQRRPRFARKRNMRKKPISKRSYGVSDYANMAYQAFKGVMWLKGLINAEKKFVEFTNNGAVSTTAQIDLLTGVGQGDTQISRNGNSIKAYANSGKYRLSIHASATNTSFRIIIFMDKVSDGTEPTGQELLDLTTLTSLDAHYNVNNAGSRFTILHDKRHSLSINGNREITGSYFSRLNHHVKFTDTTAAQASCSAGHLYSLVISSEATNTPTFILSNVFRYYDN